MADEWERGPEPESNQPHQDDIDKRIEDIRRVVVQGANEAQQRIKRVVDKANEYWQQTQAPPPAPRQSRSSASVNLPQPGAPETGAWRATLAPIWISSPGPATKCGKSRCRPAGRRAAWRS